MLAISYDKYEKIYHEIFTKIKLKPYLPSPRQIEEMNKRRNEPEILILALYLHDCSPVPKKEILKKRKRALWNFIMENIHFYEDFTVEAGNDTGVNTDN